MHSSNIVVTSSNRFMQVPDGDMIKHPKLLRIPFTLVDNFFRSKRIKKNIDKPKRNKRRVASQWKLALRSSIDRNVYK